MNFLIKSCLSCILFFPFVSQAQNPCDEIIVPLVDSALQMELRQQGFNVQVVEHIEYLYRDTRVDLTGAYYATLNYYTQRVDSNFADYLCDAWGVCNATGEVSGSLYTIQRMQTRSGDWKYTTVPVDKVSSGKLRGAWGPGEFPPKGQREKMSAGIVAKLKAICKR